ncbi:acetylglutamate kinase [Thalassobacillus sp. C254]|uniref:acetylglutamate kinase n=1 Tax=Thalassobacillus sp. C254 TaxID=1225341 RepID=UPI0006D20643|nr:acetylglutamate kinase [Thalassobacillus sp. C254]
MMEIVVIKCGGSTVDELNEEFFKGIVAMQTAGKYPIIVHGGGPAINSMLEKLEVEIQFIDGLRKTTPAVLEVAEMVLSGKVNKQIVQGLQRAGGKGLGISGCDGSLLQAVPVDLASLGLVGQINNVNVSLLHSLLNEGTIPVLSPIACTEEGDHLNVNADAAASSVANYMKAQELVFVTDVDGVLKDGQLLEVLSAAQVQELIDDGTVYGGMIPKVKAAVDSLQGEIEKVVIAGGKAGSRNEDGTIKGTAIVKEVTATL